MGKRRCRHMNPVHAGALMAIDARFLAGAHGSVVSTWANRGSATYDMTQSDNTLRPLLQTGSNGIGGQHAVDFDGTDDRMVGASDSLNNCTVISAFRVTSTHTAARTIFAKGSTTNIDRDINVYVGDATYSFVCQRVTGGVTAHNAVASTLTANTAYVGISTTSASALTSSFNNRTETSTATVTSSSDAVWSIGARLSTNAYGLFFTERIGSVAVWNTTLPSTSALRKRCAHAAAYSFRIPCS